MARNSVYEILLKVSGAAQAKGELETVERTVNVLGQLQQSSEGLVQVGQQLNDFASRAALANANMERGLTNLQAIMGASREDVVAYNEALTEQLERTKFQISRNDALTASYDAASAGYTESADAMGVMAAGMDLAIAGTSGLESASDNMASAQKAIIVGLKAYNGELAQYGGTAEQASVVSRKLYSVIEKGITDIRELAPAFAELAPTAQGAGLSLDEVSLSFAQITAAGINASQATTGMTAVLSALASGGSTEDAKKKLEEAGVSFDVAAIKANGLISVLQDLQEANLTGFDDLFAITGSTEAANALLTMLDESGDKLNNVKVTMEDIQEAGGLASALDVKLSDRLAAMTEATNKFESALADLGSEVMPLKTDLLNLATSVMEAFSELPDWLQNIIGLTATLGAGVVVTGGTMVIFASQIGQAFLDLKQLVGMAVQSGLAMKTAAAAQAGYTAATALTTKALIALNIPLTGVLAKLALIAAPALAAAAAIAALYGAWKAFQAVLANNRAIDEADAKLKSLADTEDLVETLGAVGIKMRETGQALPEAEFQAYLKAMKEANDEHGSMDGHIRALTNLQNELKEGTAGATGATREATGASKDRAASLEEQEEAAKALEEAERAAMEAVKEAAAASREAKQEAQEEIGRGRASGDLSISEAFKLESAALAEYDKTVRKLYGDILNTQSLSAERQKEIQTELSRHNREQEQARFEFSRDMAEQNRKNIEAQNTLALLALEERAAAELWSDRKLADEKAKLRQTQLTSTIAAIEAELATVADGSERQRELTVELFKARADLAQQTRGLADRETRAQKEAYDEQVRAAEDKAKEDERLAKEETRVREEQAKEQTRLYKLELDTQLADVRQTAEQRRAVLSQQSDFTGLQGDALGNFGTAFNAEQQAGDQAADAYDRLADLAEGYNDILDSTAEKRSDLNAQLKEAKGDTEKTKEIQARIAQLEAERAEALDEQKAKIREQKAELAEMEATEKLLATERQRSADFMAQLGLHIDANGTKEQVMLGIAQARLVLEEKQVQIKLQQAAITSDLQKLEQDRFIAEQQRALLQEGLSEKESGLIQRQIAQAEQAKGLIDQQLAAQRELAGLQSSVRTQAARTDLARQGIDPRALGGEVKLDPASTRNMEDTAKATQQSTAKLDELAKANQQGSKQIQSTLQDQLSPVPKAVQEGNRALESGFGSQLAATQAQTAELAQQLASLEGAVIQLPGRIAASLPRPQPAIRGK